ncbi:MAG: hypothetical protein IT385_01610 [Deltaproteobacteria bacterium]|nr:hypothetical protein [Deltaproteobacteria bacterium]
MDLIGMPDGAPGKGHAGVTHTLKHYLDPAEVWEDLVPEGSTYRPWDVLDELGPLEPPPWRQWKEPGEALRARWQRDLVPTYRHGYRAVVQSLAQALPTPGSMGWFRIHRGWITTTSAGVIVMVSDVHADGSARLKTAFRPLGYTLKNHRAVPMDARSRELRSVIARQKAVRKARSISGGRT